MRGRDLDSAGFSLVEVVIAMFILGIIAIALLPGLVQGIRFSAEQSQVATATRQLNAAVERARDGGSCAALNAAATAAKYRNGSLVTSGAYDYQTSAIGYSCSPKTLVRLALKAETVDGVVLARVNAEIFVDG